MWCGGLSDDTGVVVIGEEPTRQGTTEDIKGLADRIHLSSSALKDDGHDYHDDQDDDQETIMMITRLS